MGYGHLRAAYSLADALKSIVLEADRAPLADADERKLWKRARSLYELTSRVSQLSDRRCSAARFTSSS